MSYLVVVTRRYSFEAGHWLPKVAIDHKCKRPHGHNYEIEVSVVGSTDEVGFVIDFWDLDKVVDPIVAIVDHRMLNEIQGLENPTAENIGRWFFKKIAEKMDEENLSIGDTALQMVRVFETKNCWADISGV